MNSRERVFAMLDGRPVDCLPVMPITMMFAADQIGARYFAYTTDYHVLAEARDKMGPAQVLLGNLDPVCDLRNGTEKSVYSVVAECHRQAGPRYIVGAGCEVPRDAPAANVHAMVRYARQNHALKFCRTTTGRAVV